MSGHRFCSFVKWIICVGVFSASSVFAGSMETDFVFDTYGNTNRWDLHDSVYDANGRKISNDGDFLVSPVYSFPIERVVTDLKLVNPKGTNLSGVVLSGRTDLASPWCDIGQMTFQNGSVTNVRFAVAPEDGFCQLKLTYVKTVGTLRVSSFSATWREPGFLPVPENVHLSASTSNSLSMAWDPVTPKTTHYECRVFSFTEGVPSGTVCFEETFDSLANTGGNPKQISGALAESLSSEWTGTNVYLPKNSQGVIQIGSGDVRGVLQTPPLPENVSSDAVLVVRARRYPHPAEGSIFPVSRLSSGVTNAAADLVLSEVWENYAVPLSDVTAGDSILFHSFTNGSGKRVWLDSVRIFSDYQPGVVTTNLTAESNALSNTVWTVRDLIPGARYACFVRATDGTSVSDWSDALIVTLPAADAPASEGAIVEEGNLFVYGFTDTAVSLCWDTLEGSVYQVSVWTNRADGTDEPVLLSRKDVTAALSCVVSNLPATAVFIRVAGLDGSVTNFTRTISVNLAQPLCERIRCVSVGTDIENFDWVTNVTKQTDWSDGQTIPGIYVVKDGNPVDYIRQGRASSVTSGLYASVAADDVPPEHGLSLRASDSSWLAEEVRILNDTARPVRTVDMTFDAYQWSFNNPIAAGLVCTYAVVPDILTPPGTEDWRELTACSFTTPETAAAASGAGFVKERKGTVFPVSVKPGEALIVRWTLPRQANSPILGIGGLRFQFEMKDTSTVLFLR